jgi:hypothetical protein
MLAPMGIAYAADSWLLRRENDRAAAPPAQ